MLRKMNIATKMLSEEEKEDLGMGYLMKEAQDSAKVSRESVMCHAEVGPGTNTEFSARFL